MLSQHFNLIRRFNLGKFLEILTDPSSFFLEGRGSERVFVCCVFICTLFWKSPVFSGLVVCVPKLVYLCARTHAYTCRDSFICVLATAPWRILTFAMTHSCVCSDSFIGVPRLMHIRAMTHLYVCLPQCHDTFLCVPWLNRTCAATHSYVCHDLCMYAPWLIRCMPATVPWHLLMCAMTHSYVCSVSFICPLSFKSPVVKFESVYTQVFNSNPINANSY